MPKITTNDLKNGMTLELGGDLFSVVEFQHVKPGKGPAFVRTTLRNVRSGAVVDRTFRSAEKVERVNIDKRSMNLIYKEGDNFVFMDNESYAQMVVTPETVGGAAGFVVENSTVILQMVGSEIVGVDLPAAVELTITETEPGMQGDRVSGATKPATLETGLIISVPLFITSGERVKVDTRSGAYISRVAA